MVLHGQERVGQVAEELLQQTRHAVDIMIEVLGISEVQRRARRVYHIFELAQVFMAPSLARERHHDATKPMQDLPVSNMFLSRVM